MIIDIEQAIETLKAKRKCFVSEADFQLELAWILKDMYPSALVRCEYVPEFDYTMHIDILVILDGKWIPIELKYKTKGSELNVDGEKYVLKNHGAKDIGCYLYLYDVQRIETVKACIGDRFSEGYAIMITNELSYCRPSRKKDCVYAEFSIDEGCNKTGILDWAENTGEGTKKGCSEPISLSNEYVCHWNDYSVIEDSSVGVFKSLILTIE